MKEVYKNEADVFVFLFRSVVFFDYGCQRDGRH